MYGFVRGHKTPQFRTSTCQQKDRQEERRRAEWREECRFNIFLKGKLHFQNGERHVLVVRQVFLVSSAKHSWSFQILSFNTLRGKRE